MLCIGHRDSLAVLGALPVLVNVENASFDCFLLQMPRGEEHKYYPTPAGAGWGTAILVKMSNIGLSQMKSQERASQRSVWLLVPCFHGS